MFLSAQNLGALARKILGVWVSVRPGLELWARLGVRLVHAGQAAEAALQLLQAGLVGRPAVRVLQARRERARVLLQRVQVPPQRLNRTAQPSCLCRACSCCL